MEKAKLESLSPISLHYKTGPLFQNEEAILKIKGQICPGPLPKLSLFLLIYFCLFIYFFFFFYNFKKSLCMGMYVFVMFVNCAKLFSENLYRYVRVVNEAKIMY